jgi:hypothetical protein
VNDRNITEVSYQYVSGLKSGYRNRASSQFNESRTIQQFSIRRAAVEIRP